MVSSKLKSQLCNPFTNLSSRARLLQFGRIGTSLISIVLVIILLILPFHNSHFYLAKLDCNHADVSNGIFTSLQSAMNSGESDSFMTTSEIQILAQYASREVSTAAQFMQSSVLGWCYGTFNSVETYNSVTNKFVAIERGGIKVKCSNPSLDYVFDYREELSDVGLDIVLSYAYIKGEFSTEDEHYVPDKSYELLLAKRRKRNEANVGLLIGSAAMQTILFILGMIYYSLRRRQRNDKLMPTITRQIFGFMAAISFLAMFTSALITVSLYEEIKREIRSQLGDFGLTVHSGPAYLFLYWFIVMLQFICIFLWGGPVWCATSESLRIHSREAEEETFLNTRPTSFESDGGFELSRTSSTSTNDILKFGRQPSINVDSGSLSNMESNNSDSHASSEILSTPSKTTGLGIITGKLDDRAGIHQITQSYSGSQRILCGKAPTTSEFTLDVPDTPSETIKKY